VTKPQDISLVDSLDQLTAINGEPSQSTQLKILTELDDHARNFVNRSPFLLMGTGAQGSGDVSPRGDEPGFVKVLDETTLLIPERPGNRIADTLRNILNNPAVGILMLIPGMDDTLRVNGDAYISDEKSYLEMLVHKGKPPKLSIVIDVKEVYFHCPKAFIRSSLWDPESQMPREQFPTLGKILIEQIRGREATPDEVAAVDAGLESDIQNNLYHS